MQKGAAVVNNENLSNQAIKIELNQLELKYKLKELDAKLITEKEDLQTWMLSGKLEEHKGTKTIERKPTKAESEEEVSEADRKLHERIAAEVKAQLEAKGKSTEGVETFEEFYGLLRSEAVVLQKKYQPQLRDGIKIAVDLVNSVKEDKVDGDVDVKVKIAPNETTSSFSCKLEINDNEVILLQKVKDARDYIFTSSYMNSLASYDDDDDRPGMRPRYIAFKDQLNQFINDIDNEVGHLEKDDKDSLVNYDKKMQILRKVKEITEDLITINNAKKERSKLQTLSEDKGKEIGNRNIAFGLHSDILWKKETLLKAAQFVSISGKDNLPNQGVKEGQKISKHSIDKLGDARDAAKKYSDVLILVPNSLGKKSPDPFTGKNDAKGKEINPKGDARGVQDAERRVFVYFHKNIVSKLEKKLNTEQDLAEEKNTVTGTVSLYSQMTPCDFCSGASQVLKREFNSIDIEIESGVNYHL
jgi:hypothetical protein